MAGRAWIIWRLALRARSLMRWILHCALRYPCTWGSTRWRCCSGALRRRSSSFWCRRRAARSTQCMDSPSRQLAPMLPECSAPHGAMERITFLMARKCGSHSQPRRIIFSGSPRQKARVMIRMMRSRLLWWRRIGRVLRSVTFMASLACVRAAPAG